MPKYFLVGVILLMANAFTYAQINTPLKVRDAAGPDEVNEVVIDFERYMIRKVSYPSKANKNSIIKTLYYKVGINDNKITTFEWVKDVTEEIEAAALPLYFSAPAYGSKAKEDGVYDKDFRSAVEKPAKKFGKYKESAAAPAETLYLSFNFIVK